jgi:hypothetical protein
MDIRVGRYISLPDIEAQLAPNNYTYSHSGVIASGLLPNQALKVNREILQAIFPACLGEATLSPSRMPEGTGEGVARLRRHAEPCSQSEENEGPDRDHLRLH